MKMSSLNFAVSVSHTYTTDMSSEHPKGTLSPPPPIVKFTLMVEEYPETMQNLVQITMAAGT